MDIIDNYEILNDNIWSEIYTSIKNHKDMNNVYTIIKDKSIATITSSRGVALG